MAKTEEAKYKVTIADGPFEVREYEEMIVATVETSGEQKDALQEGFFLLANYIFGNNTTQKKIPMTAPISRRSEKIPMTVPVIQKRNGEHLWSVEFVLPSYFNLDTIPTPNNSRVQLFEREKQKFLVIRYKGRNTKKNIQAHLDKIISYAQIKEIKIKGPFYLSYYNPPWTLPFLRRNEIMFEIT
ncbi:SOUL family heme-binding protein [Fluviispira multicolorata]|uniref:Heme-binding protein n=1 Tax=Fluviispira multicolorata TaxID=2654512 RepID=A0A833JFQ3_9BACT|nr:heme-binding protein [Fluviispira multicolorata]KAB8033470.1 heme-binding protein [Fluviispira multicolorata]